MKNLRVMLLATIVSIPVGLRADEPVESEGNADDRFLLKAREGVEWAVLQGATDSRLFVTSIDAVDVLRSTRSIHGVAPQPVRYGSTTIESNPPDANMKIMMGISETLAVHPLWGSPGGPKGSLLFSGGDGSEGIDTSKLRLEDLEPSGRVAGTGKTRLGVGIYIFSEGRGFSGDVGSSVLIPHKAADFYELAGPYDCARLPFQINMPGKDDAPNDAEFRPIVVWFPKIFKVARQKKDLDYSALPKGSVVLGVVMNGEVKKENKIESEHEEDSDDDSAASRREGA